jgi:hypothetical protein
MSLYQVRALQPDVIVEVGWSYPAYFWQIFDARTEQPLDSDTEVVTVHELVEATTGLVDWNRETDKIARLVHDPWLEESRHSGRSGTGDLISLALANATAR